MTIFKPAHTLLLALIAVVVGCQRDSIVDSVPDDCQPIPLRGIHADIDNGQRPQRAVAALVDSIGRYTFQATDEMRFTLIERTHRPIRPSFSYDDVRYSCTIDGENVSWQRQTPDHDIFWSDGSEPHTFIGYILPHADGKTAQVTGYDWHHDTSRNVYYGSIGNPAVPSEVIDYTNTPAADKVGPYDLERLRQEDLLLTYDTEMQNEDAMAWVHFHHGLASVRVVVTITGFSATGTDPDAETRVTDLVLHDQPTMYKWEGLDYRCSPLEEADQQVLGSFTDWGGTAPAWNQKKDMRLWQPREHHGSGASRTFTFYGIVAPSEQDQVNMDFSVSYPDPLDPAHTQRLDKTYTATLDLGAGHPVEFRPGYCTSINVNLNHKDEKMTVGAEYMSWQFDDSPDEGSLRKNTTFLSYIDRSKVTIVGDSKATSDDATWLYAGTSGAIYDIYGNDGTPATPYLIKTADQLLSFAYEVKGGRDFTGQYIKLDADITLQKNKDATALSWIGIGDDTHPFNGVFLGSGRFINRLKGPNLFHTIGPSAVVDKLNFNQVLEVEGSGVVADRNQGLICGCYIDGDVRETSTTTPYTGSIVGQNHSFIIACAHVGEVSGYNTVGGLVGFNNGTIMACYHAGDIIGLGAHPDVHATVGRRGDGTGGTNNSIMFSCYYDESAISHVPTLVASKSGFPLSTTMMQSSTFVTGSQEFLYDGGGAYQGSGQSLHDVLLHLMYSDAAEAALHSSETSAQLMQSLVAQGLEGRVNEVFAYHFSLNEALTAFRYWLNAMPDAETVHTNCHDFTPQQIAFLKLHYTSAHQFVYTPATYPKVQ